MPDLPSNFKTDKGAAKQHALVVGHLVADKKKWPADWVKLYDALVEAAYNLTDTPQKFFVVLGEDLRQTAGTKPPESWGDLYRYAMAAADTAIAAEDEAWLNSIGSKALGTIVDTATDIKKAATEAGKAGINVANAGAEAASSIAKGKPGGILLGLLGLGALAWALS